MSSSYPISIFPNPSNGILQIEANDIETLKAFSVEGKELRVNLTRKDVNNYQIEILDKHQGLVIFSILEKGKTQATNQKVILK